jgi:hypothetical protein
MIPGIQGIADSFSFSINLLRKWNVSSYLYTQ